MAADLHLKKVRKSNFSPEEIEALVSTVSSNYQTLYGAYAKSIMNRDARNRVWLKVLKQVNEVSLDKRTLQEVKNKWKKCQHLYKAHDYLEFLEDELDSMPLQQRISQHASTDSSEPVLQSQPLSPTKLKVTRQATKPPTPKPPTPEPLNDEVCLRWNSHHANMQSAFPNLLVKEQYVDATLVAEGKTLKCHRMILSSCSTYFEEVLNGISPYQHPVLFMKDIPFWVLKSLCDFMYAGEVHIFQNKLQDLLNVAEALKIKGLAGKSGNATDEKSIVDPQKKEETVVKEEKKKEDKKRYIKEEPSKAILKPSSTKYGHHSPTLITKPTFISKNIPNSSKFVPNPILPSRTSTPNTKMLKSKEKTITKPDDIIDPLDLLEPVYEEITKETKPSIQLRPKEIRALPLKKGFNKKLRKRRFNDDREESPPPFNARKGTRSRPNVKVPKYFHSHYEPVTKQPESQNPTIVREPHTDQHDPLIQVEDIKAEPIDFDDNVIEIEDNMVNFGDQEMATQETIEEEIIGNYDSPIVNCGFKKITLMPQPVIMDVHTVKETTTDAVKVVDIAKVSAQEKSNTESIIEETDTGDPLNILSKEISEPSNIVISNIESVVDEETQNETENNSLSFKIENITGQCSLEEVKQKEEHTKDEPQCTKTSNSNSGAIKDTKGSSGVDGVEDKKLQNTKHETNQNTVNDLVEETKVSLSSPSEDNDTDNPKCTNKENQSPILPEKHEEHGETIEDVPELKEDNLQSDAEKTCEDVPNGNRVLELEDTDVEMLQSLEASTSYKPPQSPEKTLEMIVKDLNKSLVDSCNDSISKDIEKTVIEDAVAEENRS